ncbi:MAG: two-component regulator propeller domain-containing protein, partial [Lysobacterales bacterium]
MMAVTCAVAVPKPVTRVPTASPVQRIEHLSELSREVWTTRNGLPHNQVNAIEQTPDGYLWFATWEGVARYNGVRFRVFDRSNTPALADNGARSLHVMRDGGVLIGTSRGGVTAVNAQGQWRSWRTAQGLISDEVMSAIEDRRGRIWVATESAGVDRIDRRGVRHFGQADGLTSDVQFDLAEAVDGAIWVASALGVARISDDGVETLRANEGLPKTNINDIRVASDGAIWVATQVGGFVRREGSDRFERITPEDLHEVTTSVLPETANRATFGTVNEGVVSVADGTLDRFRNLRTLPNNRITALFRDREDSLWVGTSAGLMRMRDTPFSTWTTDHGLTDDYVRTMIESADGTLWIGTSRGLSAIPPGSLAPVSGTAGLPTESILGLGPARDGGLWIGTYADGLMHFRDGKVVRRWTESEGLAD